MCLINWTYPTKRFLLHRKEDFFSSGNLFVALFFPGAIMMGLTYPTRAVAVLAIGLLAHSHCPRCVWQITFSVELDRSDLAHHTYPRYGAP